MSTITSAQLSDVYQKHFSIELLKHAVNELRLNQFAMQAELPKNEGAKQVTFFRKDSADSSNVQVLTEGNAIDTFRSVSYTKIEVPLVQYGEAIKITDIVHETDVFQTLQNGIQSMGEDAALKADDLTRDELAHPTTGATKRYAGGAVDWNDLAALSDTDGKVTAADFLDACTNLRVNLAPRCDGGYTAIVSPQVCRDLMQYNDWLEASKYGNIKQLYKGELGELYGVRFVQTTNPFLEDSSLGSEGTYDASGDVYTSFVTGRDAYGCPRLAGNSPASPRIIINNRPDKTDPLNQFITAGWKAFYAAKTLNPNWVVSLRSKSAYAG